MHSVRTIIKCGADFYEGESCTIMAVINIKEGTTIFVPWRIQGIVRNEDRILHYNLHLLEKQYRYLLNCITREQIMATNRLERFLKKFNSAARLSSMMPRSKHYEKLDPRSRSATRSEQLMNRERPWRQRTAVSLPSAPTSPLPKRKTSKKINFVL